MKRLKFTGNVEEFFKKIQQRDKTTNACWKPFFFLENSPQTQCCLAPRPSPQCCQAPPASTPELVLCCQMRPEPANPCCQAAAAASSQTPPAACVCSAPRPVPCRCAPPPPTSSQSDVECALAACPIFIARCPVSTSAPQPAVCQRRRYRRDAHELLVQRISHNIPFELWISV